MKLHTLHDCLTDSALLSVCKRSKLEYVSKETLAELARISSEEYIEEGKKSGTLTDRCAFCCEPWIVYMVREICKNNGTTMSAFLRACCQQLVEEYNYGTGQGK